MTEKEIIKNLKGLKDEINPDKSWVNSTKSQILKDAFSHKEENIFDESEAFSSEKNERIRFASIFNSSVFQRKAVATALASVIIMIGLFGFAEQSVPGDTLYSLKKLKEQGAAMLVSEVDRPLYELERANKRLDEMEKIVRNNQTENLASAVDEYEESVHSASEEIKKANPNKETTDKIVMQTEQLKENESKIEAETNASLKGTEEINESLETYYKKEIKRLIKDLKERSLTEEKRKNLEEAEKLLDEGEYEKALEKILY